MCSSWLAIGWEGELGSVSATKAQGGRLRHRAHWRDWESESWGAEAAGIWGGGVLERRVLSRARISEIFQVVA